MRPIVQALVLAERIYTDKSEKKIIAGTFNEIVISKNVVETHKFEDGSQKLLMPGGTDPGCPSAYISLTDVVNNTEITLQIVNVSKNRVLFGTSLVIACQDRLATIEIIIPLPPFRVFLNEPGIFSFDVVWKGEILGSHRVIVTKEQP